MLTHSSAHRFTDYTNLPFEIFIAAFTLLPIVALIYFYPVLPESVPEYLNLRGEVEVWGRKGFASVFRLPLMSIDMQMLCLLMKYGSWQGKLGQPVEETGKYAAYREESLRLQMRLWDWLRALVAVKLGASALEVIFLSIERFHFLSTAVRIISWAAAVLGIVGILFYGYRWLRVNRKLKEAGGNNKVPQQIDPSHLHAGILYYNPTDPSFFNNKYLFNFANKLTYIFLVGVVGLPFLMFLPML